MKNRITPAVLGVFFGFGLGCFGFYWCLVSKFQPQQMVAAIIAGLATALSLKAVTSSCGLPLKVKPHWVLALLGRLPGKVLRDLWVLTVLLGQALVGRSQATGALKEIPLEPAGDEAECRGRGALLLAGISVPPNTIAISVGKDSLPGSSTQI